MFSATCWFFDFWVAAAPASVSACHGKEAAAARPGATATIPRVNTHFPYLTHRVLSLTSVKQGSAVGGTTPAVILIGRTAPIG